MTRRILTMLAGLVLVLGTLTVTSPAQARAPQLSLYQPGTRYLGQLVPMRGYLNFAGTAHNKTLLLQKLYKGKWYTVERKLNRANGGFRFTGHRYSQPLERYFRVQAKKSGQVIKTSKSVLVRVKRRSDPTPPAPPTNARPTATDDSASVLNNASATLSVLSNDTDPNGDALRITRVGTPNHGTATTNGTTISYTPTANYTGADQFDYAISDGKGGVDSALVRMTVSAPAPGTDLLPDLVMKRLNECPPAEMAANPGGSCFSIDKTTVTDHTLLRFPANTFNLGTGPMEVNATRANTSPATPWVSSQRILTSSGASRNVPVTPDFFYATDGHNHWHIRDFDSYQLLNAAGTAVVVGTGEKHGFCLQDNVSFRNWLDNRAAHPGMPASEVYLESTSCGEGEPNALSIVHGLSVGWGDNYPTTLPNQAIDITGVPSGTYTVRVTANQGGVVQESSSSNNSASSTITIDATAGTVTWVSDDTGQ